MARAAARPRAETSDTQAIVHVWFERHEAELRSFATRLTGDPVIAEDVVQETFMRAWAHVERLREREEVGPWLYRVARNLCIDTHRARQRVVTSDLVGREASGGRPETSERQDTADPIRHLEREVERAQVREALGALTDRHRDVLFLRDIEGMAYEELGRRHGVSGDSARAVIARARRRLRDELKIIEGRSASLPSPRRAVRG